MPSGAGAAAGRTPVGGGGAGASGGRFPDRADEAKPFAGRGPDEPLLLAAVADRASRRIDAAGQRRFRDDPAVPDGVDDLVLGDDAAAVGDEKGENVEDLRLNGDRPVRLQQFATIGVERVVVEEIEHGRLARPSGTAILFSYRAKIERG